MLLLVLSYHRFLNSPETDYFLWLGKRISFFFKTSLVQRSKKLYQNWFILRYPAKQRWIFIGLGLSLCYLVASGFVFALIGVRLFGLFILSHVVLGAFFAVCLCLAVILRARFYTWNEEDLDPANLKTKAGKRKIWQVVLFWIFVTSGFVVVATALFQMLPQFSLRAQLTLFEVHKYAALEILLAAIAFFYFSVLDDSQ